MKFKAQIKAETLLDWLRVVKAVSATCIIDTSELDVVVLQARGFENAQTVFMRVPDHVWDLLEVGAGRIGFRVEPLIEMVEMFDSDADLIITTDYKEDNEWIRLTDEVATFGMRLMDRTNIPNLYVEPTYEFSICFLIDAIRLRQVVKRARVVGDMIHIGVIKDAVWTWETRATKDFAEVLAKADGFPHISTRVSLDGLQKIVERAVYDVCIEFEQDASMHVAFVLRGASVVYWQSPIIEEHY